MFVHIDNKKFGKLNLFKRNMINLNIAIATSYFILGVQNTIKLLFVKLIDNRLTRNHLLKNSSSQLAVAIRLEKQLSDKKIFVSSANKIRC